MYAGQAYGSSDHLRAPLPQAPAQCQAQHTFTDSWMNRRQAHSSHMTGIPKGENHFLWVWGTTFTKIENN